MRPFSGKCLRNCKTYTDAATSDRDYLPTKIKILSPPRHYIFYNLIFSMKEPCRLLASITIPRIFNRMV